MSHLSMLPPQVSCAVQLSEWAIDRVRIANFLSGEAFFVRFVPLLFGIAIYLASRYTTTSDSVAAIWPANGLLLAALIIAQDERTRLRTLASCFAVNVIANIGLGFPAAACIGFAIINACEVIFAFAMLHRLRAEDPSLIGVRQLSLFMISAALAPIPGAAVGGMLAAKLLGGDVNYAMTTWYMADMLGLLVIAPAFAVAFRPSSTGSKAPFHKQLALYALLLGGCALAFGQETSPVVFVLMPVCVSIAFQLGQRHAAFATLIITIIAIVATCRGWGPMALASTIEQSAKIWLVQVFCLVNHFTTLFVAAAVSQRNSMQERVEALSRAEHQNRLHLSVALDAMTHGFCLFDGAGRIVTFNARFLALYRLRRQDVDAGMSFKQLMDACTRAGTVPRCASVGGLLLTDGDTDQGLIDGRVIRISQRRLGSGGIVCTYTDVTTEKLAQDELRHASLHDPLTGLPNRRQFIDSLTRDTLASKRAKQVAVLFVDVDHFKEVNDRLGHHAGDVLLRTIGDRLKQALREGDLVARLGGDEFAVLLNGADETDATTIASRMLQSARQPVFIEGVVALVSLSIGIAFGASQKSPQDLMMEADLALYKVKQNGRNGFELSNCDSGPPSLDLIVPPVAAKASQRVYIA